MKISKLTISCLFAVLIAPLNLLAEGTESLGQPAIDVSRATSLFITGVGVNSQPASLSFDLPANAKIRQVLLYWQEQYGTCSDGCPGVGDDTIIVTPPGLEITGAAIGGNNSFPGSQIQPVSYRADVTQLNLLKPGSNNFQISGLSQSGAVPEGAGFFVLYDLPGTLNSQVYLRDGSDSALENLSGQFKNTVPQVFNFPAANATRVADLALAVAGIDGGGGNFIKVTVGNEEPVFFNRVFGNLEGNRWDNLLLPIVIPAGVSNLSVEVLSGLIDPALCSDFGTHTQDPDFLCPANPSSLIWIYAALKVPELLPVCSLNGPFNLICGGPGVSVSLDGSQSFDPQAKPLTYAWKSDCAASNLSQTSNSSSTLLTLTLPSQGSAQSCSVTLTVDNGSTQSSCSTTVASTACSLDCGGVAGGSLIADACGICGGSNQCFDCLGVPKGSAVIDSCGLCGGQNQCLQSKKCEDDTLSGEVAKVVQGYNLQLSDTSQLVSGYKLECKGIDQKLKKRLRSFKTRLKNQGKILNAESKSVALNRQSCNSQCKPKSNKRILKRLTAASSELLKISYESERLRAVCAGLRTACASHPETCASKRATRLQEAKARRLNSSQLFRNFAESLISVPLKTYRCGK